MALFRGCGQPQRILSRGVMRADVSTRKFSDSSVKGMGGGKPRDMAAYLHGYTQARTCAHTQGTQGPLTAPGHPLLRLATICWG